MRRVTTLSDRPRSLAGTLPPQGPFTQPSDKPENERVKPIKLYSVISSRFGHFLDKPLSAVVAKLPLSPNQLSLTGLGITAMAGVVIAFNPVVGALLVLTGGMFDLLDGVMARTTGRVSRFGAFLDSVLDRYADSFLFIGTAAYCMRMESPSGGLVSLGCLVGAYGTSYARARAEGLGLDCRAGLMERGERILLLVIGLVTGWLIPALWGIFILSNVTALQRIFHVRAQSSGGSGVVPWDAGPG